jgi:NADH:ubiquinone oxidoreductase subunit 4 (subunit M)
MIFPLFFSLIYMLWLLHNMLFGKFVLKQSMIFLPKYDNYVMFLLFTLILYLGICPTLILSNLELSLINMFRVKYMI